MAKKSSDVVKLKPINQRLVTVRIVGISPLSGHGSADLIGSPILTLFLHSENIVMSIPFVFQSSFGLTVPSFVLLIAYAS